MMRNRPQPPPQGAPSAQDRARSNPALLHTTKTVFVANIPLYVSSFVNEQDEVLIRFVGGSDVTEEQLTSIFAEVGPVQEFV
jgi:RNA recognition motif-containing protein